MNTIDLTEIHPADIEAELKKRGLSLASIGRSIGVDRRTVSQVVNHGSKVYAALADALTIVEAT